MNQGFIDIHSHILSGVDDGAGSLEESKAMLQTAYEEGIRTIIATPHYASNGVSDGQEKVREAFHLLQREMEENYPDMQLLLGNELYYSHGIVEDLKEGKARTMAGSRYVLVEFSPRITYSELYQAVRSLVMTRFRPIIAHVERYACLVKQQGLIEELLELGVYLQMNAKSLEGGIFDAQVRWCKKLVKQGYISFISTDAHDQKVRVPLMKGIAEWVEKTCGEEMRRDLFGRNASKVIANEYIEL